MTKHNGWSHRPDSPVPKDVEVETVEAERVLTLVELAGRPIADQLAALQGSPIKPLTAQELGWVQAIARWYSMRCAEAGAPVPPDLVRAIAACGNEVMSYNLAMAEQARRDGAGEPDKPVMN